jgi:hypothetical protein
MLEVVEEDNIVDERGVAHEVVEEVGGRGCCRLQLGSQQRDDELLRQLLVLVHECLHTSPIHLLRSGNTAC